ncbi:hypothetical protein MPTK1_6g04220 [Marchantia polymorpha subsp. ruderalis]
MSREILLLLPGRKMNLLLGVVVTSVRMLWMHGREREREIERASGAVLSMDGWMECLIDGAIDSLVCWSPDPMEWCWAERIAGVHLD